MPCHVPVQSHCQASARAAPARRRRMRNTESSAPAPTLAKTNSYCPTGEGDSSALSACNNWPVPIPATGVPLVVDVIVSGTATVLVRASSCETSADSENVGAVSVLLVKVWMASRSTMIFALVPSCQTRSALFRRKRPAAVGFAAASVKCTSSMEVKSSSETSSGAARLGVPPKA